MKEYCYQSLLLLLLLLEEEEEEEEEEERKAKGELRKREKMRRSQRVREE